MAAIFAVSDLVAVISHLKDIRDQSRMMALPLVIPALTLHQHVVLFVG